VSIESGSGWNCTVKEMVVSDSSRDEMQLMDKLRTEVSSFKTFC